MPRTSGKASQSAEAECPGHVSSGPHLGHGGNRDRDHDTRHGHAGPRTSGHPVGVCPCLSGYVSHRDRGSWTTLPSRSDSSNTTPPALVVRPAHCRRAACSEKLCGQTLSHIGGSDLGVSRSTSRRCLKAHRHIRPAGALPIPNRRCGAPMGAARLSRRASAPDQRGYLLWRRVGAPLLHI